MKATLTSRLISVLTRVSPVADEYETVWVPILMPLYRTENRRLAIAVGKTNAVAAWANGGKTQLTAPANPPITSARLRMDVLSWPGQNRNIGMASTSSKARSYFRTDTVPRRRSLLLDSARR